ncbi:peptide chain release factor family protein [Maritalea myrionectae]|uniref:peptide chain release factor family protein n=1 Tax=Maritalea myrionectae TaxID=454601 RepID=UPI0024822148|nr:peptide chain release factor-like protein [Maritalea myrionectae]
MTAKDCRFDYYRGSGKGGQHRNKTDSAVRCTHIESGAVGKAEDNRSQHKNKQTAFRRMAETQRFKDWHKIETARRLGRYVGIDDEVDRQMKRIRVEVKEGGKWVPDPAFT